MQVDQTVWDVLACLLRVCFFTHINIDQNHVSGNNSHKDVDAKNRRIYAVENDRGYEWASVNPLKKFFSEFQRPGPLKWIQISAGIEHRSNAYRLIPLLTPLLFYHTRVKSPEFYDFYHAIFRTLFIYSACITETCILSKNVGWNRNVPVSGRACSRIAFMVMQLLN